MQLKMAVRELFHIFLVSPLPGRPPSYLQDGLIHNDSRGACIYLHHSPLLQDFSRNGGIENNQIPKKMTDNTDTVYSKLLIL